MDIIQNLGWTKFCGKPDGDLTAGERISCKSRREGG